MELDWNSFRSTIGFFATLLRKKTGISLRGNRPDAVYNFQLFDGRFHTSGQPTENQFAAIRDAGFTRVINLAPAAAENSLADEAATLAALDMDYVHIPVDFKKPSDANFAAFVNAFEAGDASDTWVHCAANMRVSAFIYRYRRDVLQHDEGEARKAMNLIWEPFGAWRTFLGWSKDQQQ